MPPRCPGAGGAAWMPLICPCSGPPALSLIPPEARGPGVLFAESRGQVLQGAWPSPEPHRLFWNFLAGPLVVTPLGKGVSQAGDVLPTWAWSWPGGGHRCLPLRSSCPRFLSVPLGLLLFERIWTVASLPFLWLWGGVSVLSSCPGPPVPLPATLPKHRAEGAGDFLHLFVFCC